MGKNSTKGSEYQALSLTDALIVSDIHKKSRTVRRVRLILATTVFLGLCTAAYHLATCSVAYGGGDFHKHALSRLSMERNTGPVCPQESRLNPLGSQAADIWKKLSDEIGKDPEFRRQAVDWLAGSVRVKTESFDGMGPIDEDPRWKVFAPFHDYLLGAFPLVHTTLKLTKVNTYGLLYEWVGSDTSLKPLLLAAHQDVVPVDDTTLSQWTHPPYSGHYDGEFVWGRGSSDDKSGLIGVLASVESLLKKGFKPARSVVLAFGFDEEASGFQGAGNLATTLKEIYGHDGIAMIVDEGSGFSKEFGSWVSTPGIAEKGYFNVRAEVQTSGGHSSVPPPHTSIGILSALLVHFEKNPIKAGLSRDQPVYWAMQCLGEHAKSVPPPLRKLIKRATTSDKALKKLGSAIFADRMLESLVGTTQAIDLVQGGVKSNALPELAWAVINHRITVTSNVAAVQDRDTDLLKGLAKKFNLTYKAFGSEILTEEDVAPSKGSLSLADFAQTALEPAPLTPVTGDDAAAYRLLSGTIKGAFEAFTASTDFTGASGREDGITVAPSMMSGNTDTRFYWDLTRNIFRYNHFNGGEGKNGLLNGIHTVNEHMPVAAFLEMIHFFTTLILNADESRSL
ncbi:Gly-X carboxypeptidase [Coprinopsis marcescibilis]|uniref:Gly-X carboxypeptidase n=1 Tax=Coprinopsis marcescibilis TaxID=230819 RepID=A0A5C3L115_COPMA|nr:Gly-X carboxypeptidase [Coprinopsis marcescibilis]